MEPTDGIVQFITSDFNLLPFIHGHPILPFEDHRRLPITIGVSTNRLDLLNLVGKSDHGFGTLKQVVAKILEKPVADDGDAQMICSFCQLEYLNRAQELHFVNEDTVRDVPRNLVEEIHRIVNYGGWFLDADPRCDDTEAIPGVDGWSEQASPLSLFLIIVGHGQQLRGLARIHDPVTKIEFCHTFTHSR